MSLREVSEALNEFLFVFQHASVETVCIEMVCRRTEPCSRSYSQTLLSETPCHSRLMLLLCFGPSGPCKLLGNPYVAHQSGMEFGAVLPH